jgi:hypothetical protein
MRQDLQRAFDQAKKKDGTIYKNPDPTDIEPKLDPNEKIIALIKCLKGSGGVATAVLTDRTLHIFSRGMMKSMTNSYETVPFAQVTGVELGRKMGWGWMITVTRAANTDELSRIEESEAKRFTEELKKLVGSHQGNNSQTVIQNVAIDPLDQLKKLKELLDAGIVTQEEFDEKKKSLMGQI